jgi:hypothetical protein
MADDTCRSELPAPLLVQTPDVIRTVAVTMDLVPTDVAIDRMLSGRPTTRPRSPDPASSDGLTRAIKRTPAGSISG